MKAPCSRQLTRKTRVDAAFPPRRCRSQHQVSMSPSFCVCRSIRLREQHFKKLAVDSLKGLAALNHRQRLVFPIFFFLLLQSRSSQRQLSLTAASSPPSRSPWWARQHQACWYQVAAAPGRSETVSSWSQTLIGEAAASSCCDHFFSQFLSKIRYPAFRRSICHVSTFMWKFYLWKSCSFTPMMLFYTWSGKTAVHESWWKSITAVMMSSVVEGPALKCHWMRRSRVETLRSQVRRLTKPWSHLPARSPRPALQVHTASLPWGSFEGFFPAIRNGCFPSSTQTSFPHLTPNPYILNYAVNLITKAPHFLFLSAASCISVGFLVPHHKYYWLYTVIFMEWEMAWF